MNDKPFAPLRDVSDELWATLVMNRGSLRRFLEDYALPPIDALTQRQAGEAAAVAAVASAYNLDVKDFGAGLAAVAGAFKSAGAAKVNDPNPEIPQQVGRAAFFDVDNTLIQGASISALAIGLARRKYFTAQEIAPVIYKQIKFRITGSENAQHVAEGRQQALEFIKGRKVDDLLEVCDQIVDANLSDKIWPGTREAAEAHIAAGEQVWLVSATPVQLGQILARKLGFTGALGTVAEEIDGYFTGRLVGDILHGPGKKHAVAALAAVEGLDLAQCTAYSDSANDIPMLSMVGTAVAINPDSQLRKQARLNGWEIRDYRSVRKAVRAAAVPAALAAATGGAWMFTRKRG